MKHIALMVVYLLIVSTSFCQKKKDNTIVMDTSLSFASLRMILFQNGYTVPNADSIFISTEPKQVNGVIMVKLNFARTDSSIILKGQMKGLVEMQVLGSTLKEDLQQIYFTKENVLTYGTLMIDAWKELDKIAKILGSKRHYLKQ